MAELKERVGRRIREYRNAKGYSIEDLAHRAELNAVHLASLERGEKNITISTLEKIVNTLEISFADVFDFTSPIEHPSSPIADKSHALMRGMSAEEQEFIYQTIKFIQKNKTR